MTSGSRLSERVASWREKAPGERYPRPMRWPRDSFERYLVLVALYPAGPSPCWLTERCVRGFAMICRNLALSLYSTDGFIHMFLLFLNRVQHFFRTVGVFLRSP